MAEDLWDAPFATQPVDATVAIPGSKSLTNRALVLAALATGQSEIRKPLRARDTNLMTNGLQQLGLGVELGVNTTAVRESDGTIRVTPGPLIGEARIDVGNAGTVMRFLPPVATLADGPVTFDGDPRARERPLGPMVQALRALGADIEANERDGLPLTVYGHGGLAGGSVKIDASTSSQFVSALLLAAPHFQHGIDVLHEGPPVPSLPHIEMTLAELRRRGVDAGTTGQDHWWVRPGPITALDVVVEPDLSNAGPFLAAAMVTGGRVSVADWPAKTTQPGGRWPEILQGMGGRAELSDGTLTVHGPAPDALTGLDADLHEVGELTPVIAATAALAATESDLRGVAHLRLHETDRLAALANELSRIGVNVTDTECGLLIAPAPDRSALHGARLKSYDDHRMAMAAAVLGLVVKGVQVEDMATTGKTFPDFVERWETMLQCA